MCPLLYQILNKLVFHIKQTPKYLLNKYEMTIKVKTMTISWNLDKQKKKSTVSAFYFFSNVGKIRVGRVRKTKK